MENKNIVVHQAYYGEVNRSHSCISSTIASDKDLNSFLMTFTDRPGAVPPGVQLTPYLSGTPYSNYYVFTKTIPDLKASRSGMVFTHAIIIDIGLIAGVNNLELFFSLFVNEVPQVKDNLEAINICDCNISDSISSANNSYILDGLAALLNGESPILFSGTFDTFKEVLQAIWTLPIPGFKNEIRFRTSFTPSDIEGIANLTIVNIQRSFLPKWTGKKVIQSEVTQGKHNITEQEAYLLRSDIDNPFFKFLDLLQLETISIQNIRFASDVYEIYKQLNTTSDVDKVRHGIRVLAKISPSQGKGTPIKEQFLLTLIALYESEINTNLKALRNVTWSAFENGMERISSVIAKVIDFSSNKIAVPDTNITEALFLSISEEPKNWWNLVVQNAFQKAFSKSIRPFLPTIWKLVANSGNSLEAVLSLIPDNVKNCEELRGSIPESLVIQLDAALYNILLIAVAKKKWYIFYADLNLLRLSITDTLLAQIRIETDSSKVSGITYIASQIKDKELIGLTISNCQKELILLSLDRFMRTPSLLKDIDVHNTCWLQLWSSILSDVKNISFGITGDEKKLVCLILDQMLQGKQIPDMILKYISLSEFADISQYSGRTYIWKHIPPLYLGEFKHKTLDAVLRSFFLGEITIRDIEPELAQELRSHKFILRFFESSKNNMALVVQLFDSFDGLKDEYLSEYIKTYRGGLPYDDAQNLGRMVSRRHYSESATSIYHKSNQESSFKIALKFCDNIAKYDWWSSFFGSRPVTKSKNMEPKSNKDPLPVVVILTAIKEEYIAVREHLMDVRDHNEKDTIYEAGVFVVNGSEKAVVFIRECGAKNTTAAQETERAIHSFHPEIILFVGIAGSRKPSDFKVGDVIFPEKVYFYEGGKATQTAFKARPDAASPSFKLLEAAKSIRLKADWKTMIKGRRIDSVKADIGIIASGEQLIEHNDSEIGRILADVYNDTSAVEMEGYGFLKAALRQGAEVNSLLAGVVRGISDILENTADLSHTTNQDRRPDDAKVLASQSAAAFAFSLIDKVIK